MAIPSERALIDALIKSLHRIGRPASIAEQEEQVANILDIDKRDRDDLQKDGRSKLNYRLAWCRTYLKSIGAIVSIEKGVWAFTEFGQKLKGIGDLENAEPELFDETESVEGLDSSMPEEFGEYPIESVLIRQEARTASEVVRKIDDGRFIMDPDFQREFIWDSMKQSKLIESMLMRIPLPVFYLAEREDGKTVVVDGLQRLSTFRRFLKNELILKGLELAVHFNGKAFSNLSPKLQNRVEDAQLILYLIDSRVPEQAKLDIFERVNGGIPLTRQQMRNSIYNGASTRWLKTEAESKEFLRATGMSLDSKTMRDREFVNRFCAFALLDIDAEYRGDLDAFLATTLKGMNEMSESDLERLRVAFRLSMENNFEIFGSYSFRKHYGPTGRRSVINVALFDVLSVYFSKIPQRVIQSESRRIRQAFYELMEDEGFVASISSSTNSITKVRDRFGLSKKAFAPFMQ